MMTPVLLTAADGIPLRGYRWEPPAPARGVIQIVHGLAEHAGRYDGLATELARAGYAIYADDHRGHGLTAATPDDLGFFAGRDGWTKCLADLRLWRGHIATDHPGLPLVLLGHSMGSFLVQELIADPEMTLAGAILSGSNGPTALATTGGLVARLERLRLGPRGRSRLLHAFAFGAYNRSFHPGRTPFDWLSRDPTEVDRYIADPLCGFVATTQLWIDLLDALGPLAGPAQLSCIPRSLPLHIIAGTRDPVSQGTKGLEKLRIAYRRVGLERVTHRFYDGARHELFHETNRDEVIRDLLKWIEGVIP